MSQYITSSPQRGRRDSPQEGGTGRLDGNLSSGRMLVKKNDVRMRLFPLTRRSLAGLLRSWFVPLSLLMGIGLWGLISASGGLPAYILPSPQMVAESLVRAVLDGTLLRHTAATLLEVVLGLLIGSLVAMVCGYAIARSRALEKILSPYLVASQAVPVVAIAPLLVIWFGPGLYSKVLICALIVFFPVLVNTAVGLHSVPGNLRDLMHSLHATRWQTLRHLDIPAALPVFLGGLRIGATLSVIGAVVGEFVGADRGLGFLINVARGQFDTALVFTAVLTLIGMALGLYGLVLLVERRMLKWQKKN